MFSQIIILLVGLVMLYFGSEMLVRGACATAAVFSVRPIIIGLTVVSFATSAPEFLVSFVAAFRGSGDISVGNILGSNVINIALVLGLSALVNKVDIDRQILTFELPYMLAISVLFWILCLDCRIGRFDGLILLFLLAVFLFAGIKNARDKNRDAVNIPGPSNRTAVNICLIAAGLVALAVGANMVVKNAIFLAERFGLSEAFIGISIVAVGTSLPELATSVVAAAKGEGDITVGNIVGSNIFNICLVMGIVGLLNPAPINCGLLYFEIPCMIFISFLLYVFTVRKRVLGSFYGTIFICFFFAYIFFSYIR